jgi:transketolase
MESIKMQENKIPCRQAFTEKLLELAKKDRDIIAVTSDARGSVTLNKFADELQSQFVEIGIAEQNAVGISAGLALCGKKPFVCGPACFYVARSYEQIKVDVAYTRANVKVIGVSGGVSYGALGTTHHSLNDIAVMRTLPGMTVILPCDVAQTQKMTETLVDFEGPVYVRMGRGAVPNVYLDSDPNFTIGKANTLLEGNDLTIIGTGETVYYCLQAGKELAKSGIQARILDMHTVKPLDIEAIEKASSETGMIVVVEEHHVNGGLGSAIAEWVAQNNMVPMKIIGFPDENAVHGTSQELFKYYGLDTAGICKTIKELLAVRRQLLQ